MCREESGTSGLLRLILRRGTLFGPNVKPMRREEIAQERALRLHDLALSVLRAKGVVKLDGTASRLEYRHGLLNIQYRPDQAQLDVWFERRVLSVERFRRETGVIPKQTCKCGTRIGEIPPCFGIH